MSRPEGVDHLLRARGGAPWRTGADRGPQIDEAAAGGEVAALGRDPAAAVGQAKQRRAVAAREPELRRNDGMGGGVWTLR